MGVAVGLVHDAHLPATQLDDPGLGGLDVGDLDVGPHPHPGRRLARRRGLEGQVEIMLRFIEKAGLADELLSRNWRGFARGYNGPAYARYGYDRKLENAFGQYRVAPGNADMAANTKRHAVLLLRFGDRGELVKALQRQLNRHGFLLPVDGDFGPLTRAALETFQTQSGLVADGIAGPKSFIALERPAKAGSVFRQSAA